MMHRLLAIAILLAPLVARAASGLPTAVSTATVLIANYDDANEFVGWGSGFFVDEGIVVTNRHVVEAGAWYRVYATGSDETVDMSCYKKITRSDVKLNLDDDVAYMRAYLPCAHGVMDFADDPWEGDAVSVLGYPFKGSVSTSLGLTVTTGEVLGEEADGWMLTDAEMDVGSSGGPVIGEWGVVGVAVAKSVDEEGRYVVGYFIPSSVILEGLLYANDPRFGYTPRSRSSVSRVSSSRSSAFTFSGFPSSRSSSSAARSASSVRSSAHSSSRRASAATFPDVPRSRDGYAAIMALREKGVIGGYPDGTFRPDAGVNRAEFLKILVAGFRPDAARGEAGCFTDVRREWFATYVCAAKRLGWIDGYPDGGFGSDRSINRAEAMKILVDAFGRRADKAADDMPSDVRAGTWFEPYVAAGVRLGIIDPDARFRPGDDLTREEAAVWIKAAAG
jgi:hypothetical protein